MSQKKINTGLEHIFRAKITSGIVAARSDTDKIQGIHPGYSMSDHQIQTVFRSELVHIENFYCCGAEHGEEYTAHHEIVFPRTGTFVRRDSFGSVVADVNQVLFFHKNQPYQIKHPLPGGDVSTVIAVRPSALLDLIHAIDLSVEERPDTPFRIGHSLAEPHQRVELHRIVQAAKEGADLLEIEESVLTLVASVMRTAYHTHNRRQRQPRPETSHAQGEIVNRAKLVLGEQFREKLTLTQLAHAVYTSPYHLCRLFKREAGISIHRYLQRIRLLNALEQLADHPKDRLTSVALSLGFSSHSHFTTAFQREFGLSPSKFSRAASKRLALE